MKDLFFPSNSQPAQPQRRPLKAAATLRALLLPLLRDLLKGHPLYKEHQIDWVDVRLSPDLRVATVGVSLPLHQQHHMAHVLATLKPMAFVLQKKIAPHVTSKYVPRIRFVANHEANHGQTVDQLLASVQHDWKE